MQEAYQAGRFARGCGEGKRACPYTYEMRSKATKGLSQLALRHWWLAGWHDRDMELSNGSVRDKLAGRKGHRT